MAEYSKYLGESIYRNRKRQRMTQAELAEKAGVTEQTIRKIEHGEGNPQLDVLCALITTLMIDPAEIFYPQADPEDPARKQLEILLADCSDDQVRDLIPIVEAALGIVKGRSLTAAK